MSSGPQCEDGGVSSLWDPTTPLHPRTGLHLWMRRKATSKGPKHLANVRRMDMFLIPPPEMECGIANISRVTFTIELGQLDIGYSHSNAHRIGTRTEHERNRHRGLCDWRSCTFGELNFSNIRQHRWPLRVGEQVERIWRNQRGQGPPMRNEPRALLLALARELHESVSTRKRRNTENHKSHEIARNPGAKVRRSVTCFSFDSFCHKGFVASKKKCNFDKNSTTNTLNDTFLTLFSRG